MKKTKQWSKNLRNQKGITLISLVITIVVLIILAGVAINLTLGENGILKRAEYAREQHKMAEVKEKVELSILDIQTEKLGSGEKCTIDTLVSELPGKLNGLTITKDGECAKGTYNDCDFTIDSNLNVTINGYNPSEGGNTSGGAHTHSYTETITKAATCTEAGEKTLTCSCGDSKTETIPALGHNYVSGTCSECESAQGGFYDASGIMLVSWDEAVKEHGLNVEMDYGHNKYAENPYETTKTSPYYVITNYYSTTTKVVIPDSVTKIGSNAFSSCENLVNISIPDSVNSFGIQAFYWCTSLQNISIPKNITVMEDGVFYNCKSLTSIEIPDGVTSIGSEAFWNCEGLTSLTMPVSATIEDGYSFTSVDNLTSVTFTKGTGIMPTDIVGAPWLKSQEKLTTIILPDGLTNIANKAFYNCGVLTNIEIPDSVTTIGEYAFYGCESLTSIEIPDSVTTIGTYAFSDCTGLTSIKIPSKLTKIDVGTFKDCANVTKIIIPDSVTTIENAAFSSLDSLTSIYIPSSVETMNKWPFLSCPSTLKIYCGATTKPSGWEDSWNIYNKAYSWEISVTYGITRETYETSYQ